MTTPILADFDPSDPSLYLGMGVSWPPREDPSTGDFMASAGDQNVSDSLLFLIQTTYGEYVLMEPLGTYVESLLFSQQTTAHLTVVEQSILEVVRQREPRVIPVTMVFQLQQRQGLLGVSGTLTYRVKSTQQLRSLAINLRNIPENT